jgi:hypothetical protein
MKVGGRAQQGLRVGVGTAKLRLTAGGMFAGVVCQAGERW